MRVDVSYLKDTSILTVTGDLAESEDLLLYLQAIPESDRKLVLIDLTGVNHVGSRGIDQLITCHRLLLQNDSKSCWVVPKDSRIFVAIHLAGLDTILELCETVPDGFRNLAA